MACILQQINARDAKSLVMLSGSGEWISAELCERAQARQAGQFQALRGASVTLVCEDIVDYVEALIALDGWVSKLLLVSSDTEQALLSEFEERLAINYRVSMCAAGTQLEQMTELKGRNTHATEWVIPTSGTTGTPKLISHDFSSLTRTIKRPTVASSKLRWGLLYSPTRFAGIQVILQALCGGSALIVPADVGDLETAIQTLSQCGCNAVSATPSLWRKLAFSGLLAALDLKLVTLGGEAPDQKILDKLREHYPSSLIRHIYASTEAGVGFSVFDGQAGFPLSYFEKTPSGVELKVNDDGMLLLRSPEFRQKILVSEHDMLDEDGWVVSGDLVEIGEERCYFLGRESGAINVGGQKVHPSSVEEVLLELDELEAAHVYSVPNSILGSLVGADVVVAVCESDQIALRKTLLEHCKARLERYQIPAKIKFVDAIDLTPAGKIKR